MLAHPLEGSQEISKFRPKSFCRVGMYFIDAIAVVIPCPLFSAMAHGVVPQGGSCNFVVSPAFVAVTHTARAPVFLHRLSDLFLGTIVQYL